jgi:hypothetical protein
LVAIKKKQYLDRLLAAERYCCIPVILIGNAGTGVGSRIKGHNRRGGKWLREIHRRHTPVCIVNEHKSSQTCCFCFMPIIHPTNGSSLCVNTSCISYLYGLACRSQDLLSAMIIAISGIHQIKNNKFITRFDPHQYIDYMEKEEEEEEPEELFETMEEE